VTKEDKQRQTAKCEHTSGTHLEYLGRGTQTNMAVEDLNCICVMFSYNNNKYITLRKFWNRCLNLYNIPYVNCVNGRYLFSIGSNLLFTEMNL